MVTTALLLTLHSQNNNYGSVLQGFALYKALEQRGIKVTVLDYRPFYSNGSKDTKNALRNILVNLTFLPYYIIRTARFNNLIRAEALTKTYKKYEELVQENLKYDLYLIGSDQVWNDTYLCGQDLSYYLGFVTRGKRAAYAASLGRLADDTAISRLIERTKEFDYISVREEKSAKQLQQRGIDAQYVLDPVFLHPVEFYRGIEAICKNNGYILAYIIEKDDFIAEVINVIAKKMHKRVIQIGGFAKKCVANAFPRSAGPREFLSLIDNADFVVTSSFHGTAFSHIYHKQFAVVMPSSNTLRIENILCTAGTEDRIIRDLSDIDRIINKDIDYESVAARIEIHREKSFIYLDKVLSSEVKKP